MNSKVLFFSVILAILAIGSRASRMFIVDDADLQLFRQRRDLEAHKNPLLQQPQGPKSFIIPPVDSEPAGSDSYGHGGGHGYPKGKVGPVYTFVKTDPYAHVNWGVRHVAGYQYGR